MLYKASALVLAAFLSQCEQCKTANDLAPPTQAEINTALHRVWDHNVIQYSYSLGSKDIVHKLTFLGGTKLRDGIRKQTPNGEVWVGEIRAKYRALQDIAYSCILKPRVQIGMEVDDGISVPMASLIKGAKKGEIIICDKQMQFTRVKEGWMPPDSDDDDSYLIKRP